MENVYEKVKDLLLKSKREFNEYTKSGFKILQFNTSSNSYIIVSKYKDPNSRTTIMDCWDKNNEYKYVCKRISFKELKLEYFTHYSN